MQKQNVIVLVHNNGRNDNTQKSDDSYDSNVVDLSFLPSDKYTVTMKYITMDDYKDVINGFSQDDIIVNLCDGIDIDGYPGKCVVELLEKLNLAHTGSSVSNYEWRKSDIKKHNVSTPKSYLVKKNTCNKITEEDIKHMTYPFIVKPDYNGGSSGINRNSKVNNFSELQRQLMDIGRDFDDLIVEEYIDGREFTVLACENAEDPTNPLVFEPLECIFSNGETFQHAELKWIEWKNMESVSLKEHSINDFNKVIEFCRNAFIVMKIDGYVRFDLRMNKNGDLFINDVNPYCALYYPPEIYGSADTILKRSKIMDHLKFTENLFRCARNRQILMNKNK